MQNYLIRSSSSPSPTIGSKYCCLNHSPPTWISVSWFQIPWHCALQFICGQFLHISRCWKGEGSHHLQFRSPCQFTGRDNWWQSYHQLSCRDCGRAAPRCYAPKPNLNLADWDSPTDNARVKSFRGSMFDGAQCHRNHIRTGKATLPRELHQMLTIQCSFPRCRQ